MITGYETEVPAPPLVRRSRGLLIQAALPIPIGDTYPTDPGVSRGDVGRRVEAGVRFCTLGCSLLTTWTDDTCDDVQVDTIDPPDDDAVSFSSFVVSADESSPARFDRAWTRSRVASRMDTMISAQIAYELLTGTATGNPSLQRNATHVVSAKVAPGDVMFVLEDIMAEFADAAFCIHMDPATFSLLNANGTEFTWTDGYFETDTGHHVVCDAGHDGTLGPVDPDNPGGAVLTTAADERWIYATLPVYGWMGADRPLGELTALTDVRHNLRRDQIIRPAIIAFDPCVVIAVKVDGPSYSVDRVGS